MIARRVCGLGMLVLGCQFGSTGSTASGGMPGDGSEGEGSEGAPTSGMVDADGTPGDASTSADDGVPTTSADDATGTGDPSDTTGGPPPIGPAPWWNDAWSHRRELVITERADGPLPEGYTIRRDGLDTQTLIELGQLRTDHQDLRVVRWDGAASTELARRLQRDDDPGQQRLWWKTQAEIDGATENEYWLYWGNPDAEGAPAKWADSMAGTSPVYLAGDDFEEHDDGQCPDGWESCAPQWSVQEVGNGQVLQGFSPPIDLLLASWEPPTDVIVHARVRNANPGGCPGLVTHASGGTWIWAGYGCEDGNTPVPGISMQLVEDGTFTTLASGAAAQDGEWHSVEVARLGEKVLLFQDGALVDTGDATGVSWGGVGVSVENNIAGEFDDLHVRLYVDPEPTAALGDEERAR
jgi:hypothetical protein